jgi:hypothetical protein
MIVSDWSELMTAWDMDRERSRQYDQQSRESKLSHAYCVYQATSARFGSSTYDGYKYRVLAAC